MKERSKTSAETNNWVNTQTKKRAARQTFQVRSTPVVNYKKIADIIMLQNRVNTPTAVWIVLKNIKNQSFNIFFLG